MKKIIFIYLLQIILFTNCGTKKDTAEKKLINDSIITVDSSKINKTIADPMLPQSLDYTGDHIVKYPNGITQIRGFFRFGKRHGKWASFYETGNLQSETEYSNGIKEGTTIVWYLNGKKRYEGQFKNDLRVGKWIFYDAIGKIVESNTIK